jgi:pullulanase/glycogen debranching enzyme
MDVVYNHTFRGGDSHFHQLVPGYYHRQNAEGGFSNGSGCGNEVASDRSMVRKMMVDSLVYWAREYHVDGFRFDLDGAARSRNDEGRFAPRWIKRGSLDPAVWRGLDGRRQSRCPMRSRAMKTQS